MRCSFITALLLASGTAAADMNMHMTSSVDLNDGMSRESSGTSWQPDSSPMYARMYMQDDGMLMLHGAIFPRYVHAGGQRDMSASGEGGNSRFDAPSMFMGMWSHGLGERAQIGARLMASLDPLIDDSYGYPLLYQSGETAHGAALHDRQHPHDFISELAVSVSQLTFEDQSVSLYLGYPGEPALGPPVFMHRTSGMDLPDAPIGHHWQDSSHITWGVATLGYNFGKVKFEASAFNGHEPDEKRYAFDAMHIDSWSARASWNPTADLALQVSRGRLHAPEALEPDVSVMRNTASLIYNHPLEGDANWASSFVWGQNRSHAEGASDSFLLESSWQHARETVFGRVEHVQKSGHELVLAPPLDGGVYGLWSTTLGYVHDVVHGDGADVGLGAQVMLAAQPRALDTVYGSGTHAGYEIFLRLRPSKL